MLDPGRLVVVAGESLVDRITDADGSVSEVLGGGPFNTARALARLGGAVAFLGRISTDAAGQRLLAALIADGVDVSLVVSTDDPTLVADATLDRHGNATYHFGPAVNAAAALRPEDVAAGLPAPTAALHVGTLGLVFEPMAETIAGLVGIAPTETLVVLDPNIRGAAIADAGEYRRRLTRILARTDVVKSSVDDLEWLEPGNDPLDVARHLVDAGPSVAIVTDGPGPVVVIGRPGWQLALRVPTVEVVDTIGAGDAFGAGFIAAFVGAGRSRSDLGDSHAVRAAADFAIRVANETVRRRGAEPPTAADMAAAGEVDRAGRRPMR